MSSLDHEYGRQTGFALSYLPATKRRQEWIVGTERVVALAVLAGIIARAGTSLFGV
jgi:hypothetical protein